MLVGTAEPGRTARVPVHSHALDVSFTVQGPIPAGTRITLVAPATVRHIEFSPRTLRTGKQTLKIKLRSEAKLTPAIAEMTLQLIPPKPLGAVEFDCQPYEEPRRHRPKRA